MSYGSASADGRAGTGFIHVGGSLVPSVSLILLNGQDPSAAVEVASLDVSQLTPDLQMASEGGNSSRLQLLT